MKRRTILAGLGASALGGSALLGSGAFSRVESQRDVTVQVATDENAYLGMKPLDTPNSNNFVELDDDGHLTIDVGEHSDAADEGGDVTEPALGVNSDSFTFFDGMFDLCNQGKEEACISYELPEAPDSRAYGDDFIAPDPAYDEQVITFYYISEGGDDPGDAGDRIMVQEGESVPLPLGECKEIGLRTVTKGVNANDVASLINGEVVLTADVDGDCTQSDPPGTEDPALTVDSQITDQCPDDPGIDIDGAGTTFDVTATIENTGDTDASNVTADLKIVNPNGGDIEESKSIGTLPTNTSTTVTFSDVGGALELGAYGPRVTAEADTVEATDTLDMDIIDGCPSEVDDGQSSTIDQFCGDTDVGEDEEEKENEDEGSSGGDYVYTYTYDYIYQKGKLRYDYHYQYEYSPDAEQDPDPTPPPVDESLPCSEDGSPSPAPAPSPSPP